MAIIRYARVSTQDQHLTGQLEALKVAGADQVFKEKFSGARADRPQLAKLMASLKAGDVVLVTKLDRLGRSTRELLDLIERIGKAGAWFRSLGDPLWDTSSSQGRLLSTLLAAIAEFERDLIKERTGDGRKPACQISVLGNSGAFAHLFLRQLIEGALNKFVGALALTAFPPCLLLRRP
jgi:DNA invertase Pin-like site-specific DNA recombinase